MSTVLVVDDEPAIRSILTDALSDAGLHAWAVASGDAALRYIAGHAVDLVLSDIMMPHMSGHELLAILRERRPDLPVVLMSAGVRPDRNQGHAAFLKKPFELDELLAVVARTLERRGEAAVLIPSTRRFADGSARP